MAKYKNIGGPHQALDGTAIPHGGLFETDDPIPKAFQAKFQLVLDEQPAAKAEAAKAPAEPQAPTGKAAAEPTDKAQDVTADFPLAGDNDMRVVQDKNGWHILDVGDTKPTNAKALRKKDVVAALEEYLAD